MRGRVRGSLKVVTRQVAGPYGLTVMTFVAMSLGQLQS